MTMGVACKPVLVIAGLEDPCRCECFDIRRVDLFERAIAQGRMGPAIARPVIHRGHICTGEARCKQGEQAQESHLSSHLPWASRGAKVPAIIYVELLPGHNRFFRRQTR